MSQLSYQAIPTIPSSFVELLVAPLGLGCLGRPEQRQLRRYLALDKVSIEQYGHCHQLLRQASGDEMIGTLPAPVPLGSLNCLCHMLYYSPNLAEALANYNRFYSLFVPGQAELLDLSELGRGRVSMLAGPPALAAPMAQLSILLALVKLLTWLSGQRIAAKALNFSFTELPFAAQFQYLYGVAPSFKRERPSLQLALETLAYPVKPQLSAADYAADATLHLLFWSVNEDLNKRVYMEINRRLGQLDCSVVAVAASLNMSRHTLARRLRAGGSNYAQILERVRRDRALELLSQAQLSIEQVAERLGFAEVGSFSRAFKSWRGQSPRDYRRRALAPLRPATKC